MEHENDPQFIKDKSCVYLYAINTPAARKILMERWGRLPQNEREARECKCCGNK